MAKKLSKKTARRIVRVEVSVDAPKPKRRKSRAARVDGGRSKRGGKPAPAVPAASSTPRRARGSSVPALPRKPGQATAPALPRRPALATDAQATARRSPGSRVRKQGKTPVKKKQTVRPKDDSPLSKAEKQSAKRLAGLRPVGIVSGILTPDNREECMTWVARVADTLTDRGISDEARVQAFMALAGMPDYYGVRKPN